MELKKVERAGVTYQAVAQRGCVGCCFDEDDACDTKPAHMSCTAYEKEVGVPIQWHIIGFSKEINSPITLEQVCQKKKVLEQEVMALLNTFEEETGLRVKGINTSCAYQVNGTAHTYDLDVEVDFT